MSPRRSILTVSAAGAAAALVARLPAPRLPGWERLNYRGRSVTLSGGLAAGVGAVAGSVLAGPLALPSALAAGSALVAGGYDDLFAPRAEERTDKGLGGHLRALRSGRLSGGAVKVGLIGTGSLAAAALLPGRPRPVSLLGRAALIAGSANLVNLFDLRPGRAGKVVLALAAGSLVGGGFEGPVAAAAGATLATLPDDLAERTMLGDLGANTLGALIGVRLAAASAPTRLIATAVIGGLTIASERISFSRVIAGVPALRVLDELGRSAPARAADGVPGADAPQ